MNYLVRRIEADFIVYLPKIRILITEIELIFKQKTSYNEN